MALSAGRLRQRVTIRRKTQTKKPTGGFDEAWSDLNTVWAEVIGLNGREAVIGQALQGVSYYRIATRFGTDVTDVDQLASADPAVFNGKTVNVRSVSDPDGRREQLLILADTASAQR